MPLDSIGYLSPTGYVETKIVDADGEVLRRAADLLEKRGWCQDDYMIESGAVCLVGAINLAFGFAPDRPENIGDELSRCAVRLGFRHTAGLSRWNDEQASAEPVIARLRSAAERGAS